MRVQILLKTSLYRGKYGAARDKELRGGVTEVRGDATARDGGLEVAVSGLYDDKGREISSPFERIFLPGSKIDFYVIEEA